MTIIIRYVKIEEGYARTSEDNLVRMEERFIQFVPNNDSTGSGISNKIIDIIGELDLCITNIRSQGYGNGANMREKNSGVQKMIKNINPIFCTV